MIEKIGCHAQVSNLALNTRRIDMINMVAQDMTMKIAQQIGQMKMTEERHEFHTTFRCNVIIADPEDFWRAVNDEAIKLASGYVPPPQWVDETGPVTGEMVDRLTGGKA